MTAAEYLQTISHRLSPERAAIIEDLIERTRIERAKPKPLPVASNVSGYGGYASPVLTGTPIMVRITAEKAQEVLSRCRMFPRQKPVDETKLQIFIELIQAGTWEVSKKAPIMITKTGVVLNGRHRLTALSRSGCEAEMPVLDELGIIVELNK